MRMEVWWVVESAVMTEKGHVLLAVGTVRGRESLDSSQSVTRSTHLQPARAYQKVHRRHLARCFHCWWQTKNSPHRFWGLYPYSIVIVSVSIGCSKFGNASVEDGAGGWNDGVQFSVTSGPTSPSSEFRIVTLSEVEYYLGVPW